MSLIDEILLGLYKQLLVTDSKYSKEYLRWYEEWNKKDFMLQHPPMNDFILEHFNMALEVLEENND